MPSKSGEEYQVALAEAVDTGTLRDTRETAASKNRRGDEGKEMLEEAGSCIHGV